MNWEQAQQLMLKGIGVESQISFTRYEMLENGILMAEGQVVDKKYLTNEELNGEWEKAKFLYANTKDELMNLKDEDVEELLNKTHKMAMFNRKYR